MSASIRKPNLIERLLAGEAEQLQRFELQLAAVNTNRAAAHLLAVEHHVVGERASLERLGIEKFEVLGIGRGKRVIDGEQPLLLGVEFEHWKIDDPQKLALAGLAQVETRAELQTKVAR